MYMYVRKQTYFNPHHHAGGDENIFHSNDQLHRFQSTPPRRWGRNMKVYCLHHFDFNPHHHAGGDVIRKGRCHRVHYFNPHHHAGGDGLYLLEQSSKRISIHTTTQVVTQEKKVRSALTDISIHTTTQVVTHHAFQCRKDIGISIHTTTQVVTGLSGRI